MFSVVAAASALLLAGSTAAQSYQTHNLTPDGYFHNRYHALLSMAAYGDYNATCPVQTFTEAAKLKNFPNSTRPAWRIVNTFGPTASGASGYTAVIPEMNKALIIFRGNYGLEQNLPTDVVPWTAFGGNISASCPNCTVNRFALQGYLEAKAETNNWQAILQAYAGQRLVFSIAGHGLGGMHSLIASSDLNHEDVAYYSHTYGSPRVFNQAGATWYGNRFNGEAGERGIANGDMFTEVIPAGVNYAHAGTPFLYTGYNATNGGMNMRVCWTEDGDDTCTPTPTGFSTSEEDHYYYFTNVGQCGENGYPRQNTTVADRFIASAKVAAAQASSASVASVAAASTMSVASAASAAAARTASQASVVNAVSTQPASPTGLRTGAASSTAVVSFTALFGVAAFALLR